MKFICDQPHKYMYEHLFNYHHYSPHRSQHMFDIYSLTHIFWPLLIMFILKSLFGKKPIYALIVIIICIIFEYIENLPKFVKKYRTIEKSDYQGDTIINVIGDMVTNLIGIYIGYNIQSNAIITLILVILYCVITSIIGFEYWTQFAQFMLSK